jgi:phospholipase/lecithinase/hemolysin
MSFRRAAAAALLGVCGVLMSTAALAYSKVVVFGDSLSDNGNLSSLFAGFVPAPSVYDDGRFTNGDVAVEVLAGALGVPLEDHAYGGALTGVNNQFESMTSLVIGTGMKSQVSSYISGLSGSGLSADADALFVVWGGGNDILAAVTSGRTFGFSDLIATAVNNLRTEVQSLYFAGARDFLVPLLPDLGQTYYGTSGQYAASFLSSLTDRFNLSLTMAMQSLDFNLTGLNITLFDTQAALNTVRADIVAGGGNLTDRCWSGDYLNIVGASACSNPDDYFLYDTVHPTARVHRAVGEAMAASLIGVASTVPEPSVESMALLGAVLTLMTRHHWRRRRPTVA